MGHRRWRCRKRRRFAARRNTSRSLAAAQSFTLPTRIPTFDAHPVPLFRKPCSRGHGTCSLPFLSLLPSCVPSSSCPRGARARLPSLPIESDASASLRPPSSGPPRASAYSHAVRGKEKRKTQKSLVFRPSKAPRGWAPSLCSTLFPADRAGRVPGSSRPLGDAAAGRAAARSACMVHAPVLGDRRGRAARPLRRRRIAQKPPAAAPTARRR